MRILYCYILRKNDGGNVHAQEFIHAFKQNRNEIDVVCQDVVSISNLNFIGKILAKFVWLFVNIQFAIKVLWAYFKTKPNAIIFRHAPNHTTFFAEWLLKWLVPVILEVNAINEMEHDLDQKTPRVKLDRYLLNRANKIFVVSTLLKDYLVTHEYCQFQNIAVIENGVDIDRFDPVLSGLTVRQQYQLNDSVVIGFVGSFKIWHGVYAFLELAELLRDFPCKFLLVGEGECKYDLEKSVKKLGLEEKLHFTGFVTHEKIVDYIAAMDIVMAPFPKSHYENKKGFFGSALKVFEYMAMGKAIIVPPMGQISEVIVDNVSGRLIDSEDITTLRDEIIKMATDPVYRQKLGQNARHRVSELYTWKINAQKVKDLCEQARS
jgi:glycosyltransferase involved in cell wall biosynthesis